MSSALTIEEKSKDYAFYEKMFENSDHSDLLHPIFGLLPTSSTVVGVEPAHHKKRLLGQIGSKKGRAFHFDVFVRVILHILRSA